MKNVLSAQQIQQDLLTLRDIAANLRAPGSILETEKKIINGIELDVFKNVASNLHGIYRLGLEEADQDFLVYENERYTFAQALNTAEALGCALITEYGISQGDRIAICSRNYPEWCLAYMAITIIGAIAVPMNSWWQSQELAYGIEDSGTRLIFADQERLAQLSLVREQLSVEAVAIKTEAPATPARSFSDLVEIGFAKRNQVNLGGIEVKPDDDASIMYTSGSTGNPKGVLSTHRNIISALYTWIFVRDANETLRPEIKEENPEFPPAILANVPLFHVTGCHAQFLLCFVMLRKFVMMYKWNAEKALELIEKERISVLHGVPTMTWEVMNSPAFDKTDLRSLRIVQSGGAARPPGHLKLMQEKFADNIQPGLGYGLTETNAIGATITGKFYLSKPESTGRPSPPVTQVRIEDEQGNVLPAGEIGEICIKGATIMKGYWKKPEETANALIHGWFHTGDVGLLDEHGFLFIKDRAKDIVIRGGENIACAEVEYALSDHPEVCEAAVYGLPDERLGETVAASVQIRNKDAVSVEALQAFLQSRIAHFKVPSTIELQTEQLPRIATGKIAKKEIRQAMIARQSPQ
jgi:acyl-CoA synthetase (AMP-forming)/AMP-acid ligase II